MIKNPIIFIGTGRSGTTLVSGSILSHKDLGYPSNYQEKLPKLLWVNLLKHFFDNELWRIYTRGNKKTIFHKAIFLPSEAYSMWRYLTYPNINFSRSFLLNDKATSAEKKSIRGFFEKMIKLQGKERLAFKITGPSRIGYLLSIFPDAQFVHVKRRIIPTVSSFMKTRFWESRGKHRIWFEGAYKETDFQYIKKLSNHPAELTALQIGRVISITEREIETHKPNILTINYEDFLNNPSENIKNILDFTELTNDEACFNYIKYNGIKNNVKPDENYYHKNELKFLYDAYEKGLEV
jgi:hypothetical protein